jgi:ribonuclease P protein component
LDNRLGFSPALRLLRPAEFQAVFDSTSFKVGEANFLLLVRCNDLGHPRLGLVIAKKKVRRAVDRNRLKRQIRDSFRLHQNQLPAVDVIFLARQDLTALPSPDFRTALEQAWKRVQRKYGQTSSPAIGARQ